MESPLGKQQAGANATQSFGRNFEVNSLFPNNGPKVFQSEFTMIAQVEEDSLKPVYPAFQDLNNAVHGLDAKISGIVQRQNEDYLQEYRNEMVGIQKELMEMRKKYEDFIARNNGEEQIEELKKQLNLTFIWAVPQLWFFANFSLELIKLTRDSKLRDCLEREDGVKSFVIFEEPKISNFSCLLSYERSVS